MTRDQPYVVVGGGDVGAAAAYRLARAVGGRVLLLDAGALPGPTDRRPVPVGLAHTSDAVTGLAPAAYDAWRELERLSGQPVLTETGALVVADRDRPEVGRLAAVADRHDLSFSVLDARAVSRRWPTIRPAAEEHAFVAPRGGVLDTGRAAAVHLALARGHGAGTRERTPVRALHPSAGGVEVVLDDEVVRAEHVVVAAGTGTPAVLAGIRTLPVAAVPEVTARYATPHLLDFSPARFPALTWHRRDGADLLGVGAVGGACTRLTERGDSGGPTTRREFLAMRLPGFAGAGPEDTTSRTSGVLPDGGVVLDTVPEAPRISLAAGTGGHPVLAALVARVLADLALTGRTRHRIDAFALDRGALVDTVASSPAATHPRYR